MASYASQKRTNVAKKEEPKGWTNISGVMHLWGKAREYGGKTYFSFSTNVSRLTEDGNAYDRIYYDVYFPQGKAPNVEGHFAINVKSGFLTLSVYKDDTIHNAIFVQEYEAI